MAAGGMSPGSIRYAIVDDANSRRTCQSGCETVAAGHFSTFWPFVDGHTRTRATTLNPSEKLCCTFIQRGAAARM